MPIVKPYAFGELFSLVRAGAAWDFDPAGALVQVAANAARVDYDPATLAARGLLVEEAATNGVQNPRCEGAVVGAPGTRPTGWGFIGGSGGIPQQMAGVGVEDGLSCVDVRFAGTPSASGICQIIFGIPGTNTPAASVGQTWPGQVRARLAAGSLTNVGVQQISVSEYNGATFLAATAASFTLAAGPLRSGVATASRTLTNAVATNAVLNTSFAITSGLPIDFTVRVAAPQLWQSALSFSPSFPPVGTPGPSTRAADDLSALDIGAWFNAGAGTFVIEFTPGQTTSPAHRGLVTVDDGTGANEFRLRMLPGATTVRLSVDVAGAEVFGIQQVSGAALTRHTARFSYGPAGWLLSVNGAAPVSGAGPIPAGLVRALIGRGLAAGEYLNGWLGPRFAYYPVQYTDTAAPDGFTIRTR